MIDFTSLDYLKTGNVRQTAAYESIQTLGLFRILKSFDPILVGTIPIEIDIVESDLDIICYVDDHAHFKQVLEGFAEYTGFRLREVVIDRVNCTIANFNSGEFEYEIFGQRIPTQQQNAFKHMLVEYLILEDKGPEFRKAVINLKQVGYKTEPAFAKLLNLKGDPYKALLGVDR